MRSGCLSQIGCVAAGRRSGTRTDPTDTNDDADDGIERHAAPVRERDPGGAPVRQSEPGEHLLGDHVLGHEVEEARGIVARDERPDSLDDALDGCTFDRYDSCADELVVAGGRDDVEPGREGVQPQRVHVQRSRVRVERIDGRVAVSQPRRGPRAS